VSSEANSSESAPALERRLATILSADVAGYSRMMGANEEATVQTLRGHRAVFESLLKQHRGRIFNTAGDAILAEFPSAVDAVRCATEIQTALQTRNEHLSPEQKLQFRMGINLGDVVVQDDGDLLGDGVNVASRIQTVAEPGGVCISGSVYDQIQNKLTLQFKPLGEQQFKNIGQPIRTFTITHGERGALPVGGRRLNARAAAIAGVALITVAAIAGGGYALYHSTESSRAEQETLSAKVAAERAAIEEARRAAEEQSRRAVEAEMRAERERAAVEATRREIALQAQVQSAEEARRRAEADRKRLEDERQKTDADRKRLDEERQKAEADKRSAEARAEAEKRAAEAAGAEAEKKAAMARATGSASGSDAAPAAAMATAGGTSKFDGEYQGTMCNFPNNRARRVCWNVTLKVRDGAANASWPSRLSGKRAAAHLTITSGTNVNIAMDGWNVNDGTPMAGALSGRVGDNKIDADGRWANGARIDGHWTRVP
jgi:class 3 adenylate cyclase